MIFLDANYLLSLYIETETEHNIALNIWDKIKHEELVISNSIILEVITISNTKIKLEKEKLEGIYNNLNSGRFKIVEDVAFQKNSMKKLLNYLPQRMPLFGCLYIELMEQLGITKIATFDKHFNNIEGVETIY
ncbi:MAG: PIN domain-containing protein [Methanobacteriaceae archaeon]|jgi:predicted nucleic acid-binding protein|nr:PIN domain-containing protein [Candidatus Methanorudis spinitermitis]